MGWAYYCTGTKIADLTCLPSTLCVETDVIEIGFLKSTLRSKGYVNRNNSLNMEDYDRLGRHSDVVFDYFRLWNLVLQFCQFDQKPVFDL